MPYPDNFRGLPDEQPPAYNCYNPYFGGTRNGWPEANADLDGAQKDCVLVSGATKILIELARRHGTQDEVDSLEAFITDEVFGNTFAKLFENVEEAASWEA